MKNNLSINLALVVLLASFSLSQAQTFVDYSATLGGSTSDHKWTSFAKPAPVSSGVSGSAGQWAGTVTPNNLALNADGGSTSNQVYVPVDGGGLAQFGSDTTDFLSGGSGIYSFFSQTHYTIGSTSPLSGLQTFVLQINIAEGLTGPTGGSAAVFASAPTLTLALTGGGTYSLQPATYSLVEASAATFFPAIGLTSNVDTIGYQWDLSAVTGSITGYTVNFQTAYHGIFIGADATESSAVNGSNILTAAVPEPSTYALLGLGVGLLAFLRSRKLKRLVSVSSR